jgi:hypothetical protein
MQGGGEEFEAFHFGSGFLLRADDHKDFRNEVSYYQFCNFTHPPVDTIYLDKVHRRVHVRLLKMFWPGDTILTLVDPQANNDDDYFENLPIFHEDRMLKAMG